MKEKISQLFDYGDGIAVPGQAPAFDPGEIKELTMQMIHGEHAAPKRVRAVRCASRTLLIAAILASLFSVTALAAGLSIHQRRQAELRERKQIDAHQVTDYVEFDAAEDAAGVTLLSTINDGAEQVVYLNLSPVEADEVYDPGMLRMLDPQEARRYYLLEVEGTEGYGMLEYTPTDWDFPPEEMETVTLESGYVLEQPTPEAMHRKLMASCYDEQSKTLTLKGYVPADRLTQGEAVRLHVVLMEMGNGPDDDRRLIRDFGTVELTSTQQTVKTVRFDTPLLFRNEETGETGEVLGVELSYESVSWLVRYDSMMELCTRPADDATEEEKQAHARLVQSWLQAQDTLVQNAKLNFADGSSMNAPGLLGSSYADGEEKLIGGLGERTLDLNAVVSVTVCGETIPIP
ncbi:MAG: hypothetical protein IJ594_02565 [Oscillospiraceae bacterium]|nr:hypothetical protein [Oscillospiraceae bacterium]